MASVAEELRRQQKELFRLNNRVTTQDLARYFERVAREASQAAAQIAHMPGGVGAATRAAQFRIAAHQAREVAAQLWERAGKLIEQGIHDTTFLTAQHGMDLDRLTGMPVSHILGYAQAMERNARRTANALIAREQFGFTLSERVYKNQLLARGRIDDVIRSALLQNLSARELAQQVRSMISPNTPGGISYAAMRLGRTEINNAYHDAYRQHLDSRPWVEAAQWTLSGSHPQPDICDELADEDEDNLGAGVYRIQHIPSKPHPHCLCYVIPALPDPDQFRASLTSGEYDGWLNDQGMEPLTPQAGVAGFADEQREGGLSWGEITEQAKSQGYVT